MRASGMFLMAATTAFAMGCTGSILASHRPSGTANAFTGAWHVDWCEAGQMHDCGGFTAYLVQKGDRICGSHFGMDARGNRMDEGDPASLTGRVDRGIADVEIRSGRNHGLYRARVTRVAQGLSWVNGAVGQPGDNGEPALIPDRDVLRPALDAQSLRTLETVRRQCAGTSAR